MTLNVSPTLYLLLMVSQALGVQLCYLTQCYTVLYITPEALGILGSHSISRATFPGPVSSILTESLILLPNIALPKTSPLRS